MDNLVKQTFQAIVDERNNNKIEDLKSRITCCEQLLSMHTELVGSVLEGQKEMQVFTRLIDEKLIDTIDKMNNIIDAVNLLDKKINAMASVIVRNTDISSEELQKELDGLKFSIEDIKKDIESLIKDTNPYNKENPDD